MMTNYFILLLCIFTVSIVKVDGLSEFDQHVKNRFKVPHIHSRFAYVTWTKDGGYAVKTFGLQLEKPLNLNWLAKCRFQNFVNKTGWAYLEVESNPKWPDEMQAHAAGIAEAYLTKDLIYYNWKNTLENYCKGQETLCKYIEKFIKHNLSWTSKKSLLKKNDSAYWHQVGLIMKQITGLYEGYHMMARKGTQEEKLTMIDFLMLNLRGDIFDLENALHPDPSKEFHEGGGRCSSLIKLIGDRDIYFSHVSWSGYETMLRIIKRYNFPYKKTSKTSATIPGSSIAFSGYPGMVYSMDDFYVTSAGLAIMETTIDNFNQSNWKYVKSTNSVFVLFRTMVAARLSTSGSAWSKIFSKHNSGTYNNQWMILNYNKFEPGKPIGKGLLWIVEQMPGKIETGDVTNVLKKQGYWSSYNLPYFKSIYEISGTSLMAEKFGSYYRYDQAPRALIFARDAHKVYDIESMMKLMRYNDFTHDPLSRCDCVPPYSAELAISARCDLNPANGTYPLEKLGHRSHGSIDMKLTTADLAYLEKFIAIAGPTYDPLPPFQWSKSDYKEMPHWGHPDKFDFEPIIHHWKWL